MRIDSILHSEKAEKRQNAFAAYKEKDKVYRQICYQIGADLIVEGDSSILVTVQYAALLLSLSISVLLAQSDGSVTLLHSGLHIVCSREMAIEKSISYNYSESRAH